MHLIYNLSSCYLFPSSDGSSWSTTPLGFIVHKHFSSRSVTADTQHCLTSFSKYPFSVSLILVALSLLLVEEKEDCWNWNWELLGDSRARYFIPNVLKTCMKCILLTCVQLQYVKSLCREAFVGYHGNNSLPWPQHPCVCGSPGKLCGTLWAFVNKAIFFYAQPFPPLTHLDIDKKKTIKKLSLSLSAPPYWELQSKNICKKTYKMCLWARLPCPIQYLGKDWLLWKG